MAAKLQHVSDSALANECVLTLGLGKANPDWVRYTMARCLIF